MIVLDITVATEAIMSEPELAIRTWLNEQAVETLYLSSVTVAELLFGMDILPPFQLRAASWWLLAIPRPSKLPG